MKTLTHQSDNVPAAEVSIKGSPLDKTFLLGFLDFMILIIAFWGISWIKYRSFSLTSIDKELMIVISVLWLLILLISKKLWVVQNESLRTGIKVITKTNIMLIMLVSLMIISLRMMTVSRIQAYGSCLVFYGLEVMGCIMLYSCGRRTLTLQATTKSVKPKNGEKSLMLLTIGGALWLLAVSIAVYVAKSSFVIGIEYIDYLLMLYALWIVTLYITDKYKKKNLLHFNVWLSANIKSAIMITGGVAILVFSTKYFIENRLIIFGPIIIYFLLEFIVFYICFLYFKYGGDVEDLEDVQKIRNVIGAEMMVPQDEVKIAARVVTEPVALKLKNALEFLNVRLFNFVNENINLSSIDRTECVLLSTDNLFNIDSLDQGRLRLFINLHKLNDMRWFNQYFLSVHAKLVTGGYLIGYAHTLETQKKYFSERYPQYIGPFIYVLNFLWKRVMPKLPWTKEVYFALTKGRNRAVSMAEVFGRLYFCGFKIVAELVINDRLYFLAQKVKAPSLDNNPTYGPLICLKRYAGDDGLINVYKFRTMYPYSEYLQKYVYERNKLEKGGKFKDDFRVTAWGKFLRKTWLDELPMLYNWIRGDLKIIGVRPLSKQYLSLYNPRVRQLRAKVKPGIIPPFYADLPNTLEEIQESEERYIEAYLRQSFLTQVRYLYKSVLNIIVNNARSA